MRKFFTTLKSVVATAVIASMTLAASCSYDDSAIKDNLNKVQQEVDKVEKDLAALTDRVAALEDQLAQEVEALESLINGKTVVTNVETANGVTTVTLSDGTTFNVYPECGVVDTDTDTNTYLSIAEDNGVLYWAVYEKGEFKEWFLVDGEKVAVYDGNDQDDDVCDNPYQPEEPIAPQFRVNTETMKIEVSIDGGETWVESGLDASTTGAQLFTGVKDNGDGTVTFTLADGSVLNVTKAEVIEFNSARAQVYVKAGEVKDVFFTINDAVADINVMNQPLGWKAEVALAPVDEEDENDAEVLAAGGTEYVLKVSAPSADFVKSGYAEKHGIISVHFNTAAGACKVAKLAVDLAEITLDVDKAGNITIENSWVDTFMATDWTTGQTYEATEFNNFYVGVMSYFDYTGDFLADEKRGVEVIGGYVTNLHSYIESLQVPTYEEGVCEKYTITTSVKEIVESPGLNQYGIAYEGESFVVFVIPTDSTTGEYNMEGAVFADFKQLTVKLEVAETTWNNAYLNAVLLGGSEYNVLPASESEVNNYIEEGYCENVEGYFKLQFDQYIEYQEWGYTFGWQRKGDVVDSHISLSDLVPGLNFEGTPDTTYYLAIFAKEEGRTEYTSDDVEIFTFTTEPIVEAETPADYTLVEGEDFGYFQLHYVLSVPNNTDTVYYKWCDPTDEVFESDETLMNALINGYNNHSDWNDGYSFEVSTNVSAPGTTKNFALLIVDTEGNYTLAVEEFTSPVPVYTTAELAIESVDFTTTAATINVSGLEGLELKKAVAYLVANDANSYYLKSEADLQDLALSTNWMYRQLEDFTNGIVYDAATIQTADYQKELVAGKTYRVALGLVFADGSISNTLFGEFTYPAEGGEDTEEDVTVFTSAFLEEPNGNYEDIFVNLVNDEIALRMNFWKCTDGAYLPARLYEVKGGDGVIFSGGSYSKLYDPTTNEMITSLYGGTVNVSVVDGKYRFDVDITYGADGVYSFKAVYEGDVTGLNLPAEGGVDPEEPVEPEVLVMDSITRANFKNSKLQFFHQVDGNNVYCAGFYNYDVVDTDKMLIQEGEYVVGSNFYAYGYSNVYDYVAGGYNYDFDEGGVMKVSEVNGAYHIEFSGTLNDGTVVLEFVFDGLIEGLILPSEYVAPVVLDFVPVRAEYDNKFDLYEYNGGDAEYAFWLYDENNNYIEVIHRFGPHTSWNDVYEAKKVIDGVESVATEVATQAPNNHECEAGEKYFVVEATFEDATTVEIMNQLPAVEVNYLGEGSTYAPGSENPGVGGGDGGDGGDGGEVVELTIDRYAIKEWGDLGETEVYFYFDPTTDANHRVSFTECPLTEGVKTAFNPTYSSITGKGSIAAINIEVSKNASGDYVFIGTTTDGDGISYKIDTTNAELL